MQAAYLLNGKTRYVPAFQDSSPTWDVDLAVLLEEACGLNGFVQSGVGDLPDNGFRFLRSLTNAGTGTLGLGSAESIHWASPLGLYDSVLAQGTVPRPPGSSTVVSGGVGASAVTLTSATPTGTLTTMGLDATYDPFTQFASSTFTPLIAGYYTFSATIFFTTTGAIATPAIPSFTIGWNTLSPVAALASGMSVPAFTNATAGSPYFGLAIVAQAKLAAAQQVRLQFTLANALVGAGSVVESTGSYFSIEEG
jgi:hypothetical protein